MKTRLFCCLVVLVTLLICSSKAQAQQQTQQKYTLKGVVIDSLTNKGVGFATVAITDKNHRAINMAAADGDGKFSVDIKQTGNFLLSITAIGFSSHQSEISVDGSQKQTDLGTLYVSSGIEIKEVTVPGQRPLVTVDIDKMTYNVDSDPEAQSSPLVDILRKVPQLSVDGEDNIRLNGQTNFKVLVNGKESKMYSGDNLKDIIRSMPANSIRGIEVITDPGVRYDAEGVGGIINLLTNRKTVGYNGSITGFAGSYGSYGGGASFAAQVGKFNLSARYNYMNQGMSSSSSYSNQTNLNSDEFYYRKSNSRSGDNSRFRYQRVDLNASYDIDSLNLITLSFAFNDRFGKFTSASRTSSYDRNGDITQYYELPSRSRQKYQGISGGLDYQKLFMKPEKSLTFSYQFDANPQRRRSWTSIENEINFTPYQRYSSNKASGTDHAVQIDYYDPITKSHIIEAGAKYTMRPNTSDTDIREWDEITEQWVVDNYRLNDLDYTEHILAAYTGYMYRKQKFSVRVGARGEASWADGTAKTRKGDTKFNTNHFNLVPSLNISYQFGPTKTIRLSYTQRLSRPSIWNMNPYVNDDNPSSISYGNPNLDRAVSNQINVRYNRMSQKLTYMIGATASFMNNGITYYSFVNPDGVMESTYGNILKNRSYSLNGNIMYRFNNRTFIQMYAYGSYVQLKAPIINQKNDGFSWNANLYASIGLWKNATLGGYLYYSARNVTLQGKGSEFFGHSLNLSQGFLKQKLRFTFSVNSPFKKEIKFDNTREGTDFYSFSESRQQMRQFRFSAYYRFGKTELRTKSVRRGIQKDYDSSNGGGESGGSSTTTTTGGAQ